MSIVINLTKEQEEIVIRQAINRAELKDLIGEVLFRMSARGDLDLIQLLADYQKKIINNE